MKQTILITGASSYVGARMYFDLKDSYRIVGTYFHHQVSTAFVPLDLTDRSATRESMKKIRPGIVIHVANYPSPRSAINNEEKFIALNEQATSHIVNCANTIEAKVIFISSQAANNPDDIYGKLKLSSERQISKARVGYLIVRPSLIVGVSPNTINDRPFNRMLRCLDDRTQIASFDTSWKLQPTYVGHLSRVIDAVIRNNLWNKTIPVFVDQLVTQYQIASDILGHFGVKVNPVDQGFCIPPSVDDLGTFKSFHLSPYTYSEMIDMIVDEIRNKGAFRLG